MRLLARMMAWQGEFMRRYVCVRMPKIPNFFTLMPISGDQPSNSPLFLEIANHVRMMRSTLLPNGARDGDPMSKKRKLDNGMLSQTKSESFQSEETEVIYEARDISFAMPVRKKLQLQIAQHVSLAPGGAIPVYQVLARNQTSGEVEYTMSMQSFSTHISLRSKLSERGANH